MNFKTDEIVSLLKEQMKTFDADIDISEVGEVVYVGDGVAQINGLENVMSSELVELPNDIFGMALNLEDENVGVVLFGDSSLVKEGDMAKRTGKIVEVPITFKKRIGTSKTNSDKKLRAIQYGLTFFRFIISR